MPVIGFACPKNGRGKDIPLAQVCFQDCLTTCATGAPACGFPFTILAGIARGMRGAWPNTTVSVTELTGCLTSTYLKRTGDVFVEPTAAFWAFRGQLAHALAESHPFPGAITETRLEISLDGNGSRLTGQPDALEPLPDGTFRLVEYKSTKKVPAFAAGPYAHHQRQAGCYAYMATQAGHVVTTVRFIYFDMYQQRTFDLPVTPEKVTHWFEHQVVPQALALIHALEAGVGPDPGKWQEQWACKRCDVQARCPHYVPRQDNQVAAERPRRSKPAAAERPRRSRKKEAAPVTTLAN